MGYIGKQRIHNKAADKEELESYSLGSFSLNGDGKNDDRIKNSEASLLSNFKDKSFLHVKGTYVKPSGIYQDVQVFTSSPDDFAGNGDKFSNLNEEERKEAIKEGIRKNFYEPEGCLVNCSEPKFD